MASFGFYPELTFRTARMCEITGVESDILDLTRLFLRSAAVVYYSFMKYICFNLSIQVAYIINYTQALLLLLKNG